MGLKVSGSETGEMLLAKVIVLVQLRVRVNPVVKMMMERLDLVSIRVRVA